MPCKLYLLIFFISLLFVQCSFSGMEENEQTTDNLISEEKMVEILADIQIVEAHIDEIRKSGHQTKDSSMLYFEKVFAKHQVTPVEFESSLLYYKKDLLHMDVIYTEVITRLNELKAKNEEMINLMKRDSVIQDSLKKISLLTDSINNQNDTIFVQDSLSLSDTNNIIR